MTERESMVSRLVSAAKNALSTVTRPFGYDLTARFDEGDTLIDFPIDMEGDTVWATQQQIADLFGTKRQAITKHIANIYSDGELEEGATSSNLELVQNEGGREVRRSVTHYNLDMILIIGTRVKATKKAVAFRKWATRVLKGYIEDGYALNGARLNADPSALLKLAQEVRAIRTSEMNLWAQVREVFKLSAIDYDPASETARKFFACAQDICHVAASGKTASEIIVERADAKKPNMGLTALGNVRPTAKDVTVAKNYYSADELRRMELVGESFLLYAESMGQQQKQVSMARLLERFTALVAFYEYPVFQGYGPGRPTKATADAHAKRQLAMFKQNGDPALPPQ